MAQTVKNLPATQETWVEKIPWRRKWLPIPVFLYEESHEQRSLVGYSPWGRKESDRTERLSPSSLCLLQKGPMNPRDGGLQQGKDFNRGVG